MAGRSPANMPAIPPISATATMADTMPATASGDGRSPVAMPTATGTIAATMPVTGATTVMLPRAERDVEADHADTAGDAGRQSPPDRTRRRTVGLDQRDDHDAQREHDELGHERHRRGRRATAGAPAEVVGHAVQHGRHKRQRDGHPGRCTSPGRVGG